MTNSPARFFWLAALFAALVALEAFGLHGLDGLEWRLSDQWLRWHVQRAGAPPDSGIVLVQVDDASLGEMLDIAGRWPWPREVHADLLEALLPLQPAAVVFDVMFPEPDALRPQSDARFNAVLAQVPRVYLPAVQLNAANGGDAETLADLAQPFGMAGGDAAARAALQLPKAVEPRLWRLGTINSDADADGVVRSYRVYTALGGWRLPSLPARVASDLGSGLPVDERIALNWRNGSYTAYSYGKLFRLLTERTPDAEELAALRAAFSGKTVLIGATATGLFDHHATPVAKTYPGLEILATALDNLKNGDALRMAPPWATVGLAWLLLAALAVLFAWRVSALKIGVALAGAIVLLGLLAYAALDYRWLLPVLLPALAAAGYYFSVTLAEYRRERRKREQAVGLFSRFLNPDVVKKIVDQDETVESLSGKSREITVLFSDIRGFTTLSENQSPQQVVALLNDYFSRQTEVIFGHGGTLDKFIGDAIMAFWGAPLDNPQHARHAVEAALDMAETLQRFRAEMGAAGEHFDVGIGIHSGPAVVGFLGSHQKLDYTAIGDTVNLASRIEGLTKGVARILVSEATMRACGDAFEFVPHGRFQVKGRSQEVALYEPKRKSA
ncbi:MAG: adenylate/guanylate cyclase domain-containing protein [Pseudomonadota bacterium]